MTVNTTERPPSDREIDQLLALRLGCEASNPARPISRDHVDLFWDRIQLHGISLAIYESPAAMEGLPEELRKRIKLEAQLQALWEETHKRMMVKVLAAFHSSGIASVVFKGTGLAYSVYENAAIRRRGDSDVLIRAEHLARAREILSDLGLADTQDGHLAQETWILRSGGKFIHAIDLHWEIIGPPALRKLLPLDECIDQSIPLPRLAPHARTLSPVHALLRGAINQALHGKYGYAVGGKKAFVEDRLIWRLDAHLLAQSLDERGWDELVRLSEQKGVAPFMGRILGLSRETFGTQIPDRVESRLERGSDDGALQEYLAQPDTVGAFGMDLRAAGDGRTIADLLRQQFLPSRQHMIERFPDKSGWPMPLLYTYRLFSGFWRHATRRLNPGD